MEENKIKQEKIRKVFLEGLPTRGKTNQFNWEKSIGYKVKGIYDNIEFEVEIIEYIKMENRKNKIKIKYEDEEYEIQPANFTTCQLGDLLGKYSSDFKIEIGTRFQDDKRDITIIDKEKIQAKNGKWLKYYKYACNKCGFNSGKYYHTKDEEYKEELWTEESHLLGNRKQGCSCCCTSANIVVEGINDIPTVASWMIPYFIGGYEEAKKYNKRSNKSIYAICPDCLKVKGKKIMISNIYKYHTIGCSCSDSTPYTEKVMFNVLEQLQIEFEYHKTFDWSKNVQVDNLKLCGRKEYDFYLRLNGEDILIETHGNQHYNDTKIGKGKSRTFEEEVENDEIKELLALDNGINKEDYIIIDCRESDIDFIKKNILKSRLNELFDLSNIDWIKCVEFACSNLIKLACEYKRNDSNMTTTDISKLIGGFDRHTINSWLKQGNGIWCDYNCEEEHEKSILKMKNINSKQVLCSTTKDVFDSTHDIEIKSDNLFGIHLSASMVAKVCRGEYKHYKGLCFKYVSDLTDEEKKLYNIV